MAKAGSCSSKKVSVKVYSSRRQKSHMQRQWARLARRGWCAGVVLTAPRSLERTRREMRQAKPPARGGAARASLNLQVVLGCSLLTFDFCLSTSIPVLTTSTYVVAWPQGDQFLGGGPWHKANLPATHWRSLPLSTPEGGWPLSPLAPAAISRWFSTTGPCQVGVNRATSASFACIGASVPSS